MTFCFIHLYTEEAYNFQVYSFLVSLDSNVKCTKKLNYGHILCLQGQGICQFLDVHVFEEFRLDLCGGVGGTGLLEAPGLWSTPVSPPVSVARDPLEGVFFIRIEEYGL